MILSLKGLPVLVRMRGFEVEIAVEAEGESGKGEKRVSRKPSRVTLPPRRTLQEGPAKFLPPLCVEARGGMHPGNAESSVIMVFCLRCPRSVVRVPSGSHGD